MKRIQIIFLFLAVLTVLSVIPDQKDHNYYSEYDTRFTCGLKYDFTLLNFGHELKKSKNQEEVSSSIFHNAVTNSSQQLFVKNISSSPFYPALAKSFFQNDKNDIKIINRNTLIPPRAPPSHS